MFVLSLSGERLLVVDIRCLLYYTYTHTYTYTYIIYYYIIYYILYFSIFCFSYSLSSSFLLFPPSFQDNHTLLIYLCSSSSSHLSSVPPFLFYSVRFHSLPDSFYTCRCLLFDTYIPNSSHQLLTPHVLSEWMVEV